jgi:uncharacterized protein
MQELFALFRGVDRKPAIVLVSAAVLMSIYVYQGNHNFFMEHFAPWFGDWAGVDWLRHLYQFLAALFFFFAVPAAIIRFYFKESLADWGLQLGDWRFGLYFVAAAALVLPVLCWITAGNPEFQAEYPLTKLAGASLLVFFFYECNYLLYYIGWEFFFRGYMQFGLKDRLPAFYIIMMQTLPSTIIHIGKPQGETMAAILGGILFGAVALRTRSIVWVLLVHWMLGGLTDYFCLVRLGIL